MSVWLSCVDTYIHTHTHIHVHTFMKTIYNMHIILLPVWNVTYIWCGYQRVYSYTTPTYLNFAPSVECGSRPAWIWCGYQRFAWQGLTRSQCKKYALYVCTFFVCANNIVCLYVHLCIYTYTHIYVYVHVYVCIALN